MANVNSAPSKAWIKPFCVLSLFRALVMYTVGSLLEVALMCIRVSDGTQILSGLASDLLSKLMILLLASFIFGFSFIVFRAKTLPGAAKRFFHILLLFAPVVLIAQSLVTATKVETTDYIAFYFGAFLVYMAVYGISMIVASAVRKKMH